MKRRGDSGRRRRRPGFVRFTPGRGLAAGLVAAVAVAVAVIWNRPGDRDVFATTPSAAVRRADLDAVVLATGWLESASKTEIRCTLDRLPGVGAPTILRLVEDGTTVRKDDLLCEVDSAEYQELVRRQTVTFDQAQAAFRQAELALDVARIELQAYRLGEMALTDRQYRGQIALASSDLTRQVDRLAWTRRMLGKGYFALGQIITEELTLRRTELSLKRVESEFGNFQRFTVPISLLSLESQINGAQATFDFQTIKRKREGERLALYKDMTERCTVRAPHDGLVVIANRQGRAPEVFEGATVRQRQRQFYLPDLSRMVAVATLHETMVSRVRPGMPVKIRLEAFPGMRLDGLVASVAPMPYNERKTESANEATYFLAAVAFEPTAGGLRPGMTAELEILVEPRRGVLAVPTQAVASDGGRDVCYVVRPDRLRLERRPVRVGPSSHGLVEVSEGLAEGERVALQPPAAPGVAGTSRTTGEFGGPWDLKAAPAVAVSKPAPAAPKPARKGRRPRTRPPATGAGPVEL